MEAIHKRQLRWSIVGCAGIALNAVMAVLEACLTSAGERRRVELSI